jgi:hypothetical protein
MGLHYKDTITSPVIGTKVGSSRTSVSLTNAYDDANTTKSFSTSGYSKLNLDILYTTGSGETSNSIEIRIEGSPDGINFYRIPNEDASGGTSTLTVREFTYVGASAATAYPISIGLDIFYKYVRVSIKETGVVTNVGSAYCEYTLLGL